MADKTTPEPKPTTAEAADNIEAQIAAAKKEAEASAADIIAQAKAEAEKIIADAKEASADDVVVSQKVTKNQLIDAYDSGMSHLEIAKKFYGSASEEHVASVAKVINPHFDITDGDIHEDAPEE